MTQTIPIEFVDETGNITEDYLSGSPIIRIGIHYSPHLEAGYDGKNFSFDQINALVDTGSDWNYIDSRIVKKWNPPFLANSTTKSGTSTILSKKYRIHLFFPSAFLHNDTDAVSIPLEKNGKPYGAILGRLFLREGSLHMDFRARSFYFSLPD